MRSAMRSCLKGQQFLVRPVPGVWTSFGDPVLVICFARHAAGRWRAGGKSHLPQNGLGLGFAN